MITNKNIDNCIRCGTPLHFAMGKLFCPNPNCPPKTENKMDEIFLKLERTVGGKIVHISHKQNYKTNN